MNIFIKNSLNSKTLSFSRAVCNFIHSSIQFKRSSPSFTSLNHQNRYNYISPIDKPISSLAINSIIQLSAQSMNYCFFAWNSPAQISIVLGGIAFRIIIQIASKFVENMKLAKATDRGIYKAIQKIFVVDLQRDVKFYEMSHRQNFLKAKYYRTSYLFKNLLTSYLVLNFFRGCYMILSEPQFGSMLIHTFSVPTLAAYDPTFITPLLSIFLTYFLISKSRHPLFIHLNRPQNFLYRFNIAFMSSLLFVPLPTIYLFGYCGICTGHLLIRWLKYQTQDIKEEWRNILGKNEAFEKEKNEEIQQIKKQQFKNNQK